MSTWVERLLLVALLAGGPAVAQDKYPGIGRAATPAEVRAWDIDVRPDFQGLPRGAGTVAQGMVVWESKCASCHGVFGESNEVFSPLVGGTTEADIRTGRVANLQRPDYPGRTTLMKLPTLSSLWDYIRRAMPWNAPKSLSTDDVYAVTAYMLNLGRIVPDDFELSDRNIAEVQRRLPNRNGMSTAHALWPGREFGGAAKPDTASRACMSNCPVDGNVTSRMPEHARNAHGNLADQNRRVGAQRGVDTSVSVASREGTRPSPESGNPGGAPAVAVARNAPTDLLTRNTCTACHAADSKLVGPSWSDVAKKHAGKAEYLAGKIRTGGSGVWGTVAMPPQAIGAEDAARIAAWLAGGAAP